MDDVRLRNLRRELARDPRPSILISPEYEVLWSNTAYEQAFGDGVRGRRCYEVSHDYDAPCDLRGERCPLAEARRTRGPARVLHVHHTPRGLEHVDVSLTPVWDEGVLVGFVEHLTPVDSAPASGWARALSTGV
ncbi:MAG: PAS domain-containing protein, partial [Myxococcota bacterium]